MRFLPRYERSPIRKSSRSTRLRTGFAAANLGDMLLSLAPGRRAVDTTNRIAAHRHNIN